MDQTTRSQRSTLAGSQCASFPARRCRLQKQVAKPRSRREAKAEGTIDPGQTQARGAEHAGREKRRGERPYYDLAKARCAKTVLNPQTGEPFSRPMINGVLTTECYDVTRDLPWEVPDWRKTAGAVAG